MGRRKREPMSEGKKNIIGMLLEEYDIKTAKDIEDALKDLLGGTIQEMLEAEMDEHLGYEAYERSDNPDSRNGKKTKKIRGNFGETEIEVPQDREGTFEPKVVKKRQKDISGIESRQSFSVVLYIRSEIRLNMWEKRTRKKLQAI